ncbi:MAG: T9SS type A sorting domain-containing protein [Bacteroidales bacterium]|jgi:hypothetical protein
MKKLILFIIALLAFIMNTKAQHYYTIPDSNVYWGILTDNGYSGTTYSLDGTDSILNDTIINSRSYTKLFSIQDVHLKMYGGAFRSDTDGLTYFVPMDSTKEFLISDFSKNVGDSVYNVYFATYTGVIITNFYVDSVNYIMTGPYLLKRMYLTYNAFLPPPNNPQGPLIWIEKVGCPFGGFFNNLYEPLGGAWLHCMSYDDTTYYNNGWGGNVNDPIYTQGYCADLTGLKNKNQNPSTIDIFPNPSIDNITIKFSQNSIIKILNLEGQIINSLSAKAGNTSIDVSAFPSGMYFVEIKSEKGVAVKKFVKE